MRRCVLVLLTAVVGLISPMAGVAEEGGQIVKHPEDIAFGGVAKAAQTAILYGDPKKSELYVARVKFPAGLKLPLHTHSDAQRTVVVLSGTLYFALGNEFDESKLMAFGPGTFFTEPAGLPHYSWAKDGDVVMQLTAIGPAGMTLVTQPK
jgi:quercetin dioxygenase-like cupin family protein